MSCTTAKRGTLSIELVLILLVVTVAAVVGIMVYL